MFDSATAIQDEMSKAVDEFTDSEKESSHLGYLMHSFSTLVAIIPQMINSLMLYFMDKGQIEMKSRLYSFMSVFSIQEILKQVSIQALLHLTGFSSLKMCSDVMWVIYYFY